MSQLFIVQSNYTAVDQGGPSPTGESAPSGLAAPTVTPTDSGFQVAWTQPAEAGDTLLLKWTVSASDGTDTYVQDNLPPPTELVEFNGLAAGTYTVTLTATNSHGSVSQQVSYTYGTQVQIDPRTYDYATNTGPQTTLTQTMNTPNSSSRAYTATGAISDTLFPTGSYVPGSTDTQYVIATGTAAFSNCEFDLPVRESGAGANYNQCYINADIGEVVKLASSGAALTLNGQAYRCNIVGPVDGVWPAGSPANPAVVDTCWLHPTLTNSYIFQRKLYGGPLTDSSGNIVVTSTSAAIQPGDKTGVGTYPTAAQDVAAQKFTTNGQSVTLGQIIFSSGTSLGIATGYQVIGSVGGATSIIMGQTTEPKNWPTNSWDSLKTGDTTQPFVSGNAILISLFEVAHGDAMQWIANGSAVIRNSRLDGFQDSTGLVQNVGKQQSASFKGDFTQGDNVVRNVTDFSHISVGILLSTVVNTTVLPKVSGSYPPYGALIRSIDTTAGTITLAVPALATLSQVSIAATQPRPTSNIEWDNDLIYYSGGIYWLGISGMNVGDGLWDGPSTDHNYGGLSLWAAGTGPVPSNTSEYWDMNSLSYRSRPWSMYVHDCYFTPNRGVMPTSIAQVTASRLATVVSSIDQWKQGVANQFGLNVTTDAATLQQMWNGTYDYTQKPNVFGDQGSNIQQSVLQQRRAYGMTIGSADARSWIVAEPNNYAYDPSTNTTASSPLNAGPLGAQTNLLVPGTTNQYQSITRSNFPQAWDTATGYYIGA